MRSKFNAYYLGVPVILAIYVFVYFPYASIYRQNESGQQFTLFVGGSFVLLAIRRYFFPPTSNLSEVVAWLLTASWTTALLMAIVMLVPEEGHLTLGGFVFVTFAALHSLFIPIALILLMIDLPRSKNIGFVSVAFIYLLAASYCFSFVAHGLPQALDTCTGTKFFSRQARRLDRTPVTTDIEIMQDPALLERKRPLNWEYQVILSDAARQGGPEVKARVLETFEKGIPNIEDHEDKRRAVMGLAAIHPNLLPDASCPHDLVPFLSQMLEDPDADLRRIALGSFFQYLRPVVSSDRHPELVSKLAAYLQASQQPTAEEARQTHYLPSDRINVVSEISSVVKALQAVQTPTAADRRAAQNLRYFIPYLNARYRHPYAYATASEIEALPR